jgi:hypothetical protein
LTYQIVIQSANKNKISIRRELNKGNGWIFINNQSLDAMTSPRIPDPTQAIITAGYNKRTISIKINTCNWIRMGRQHLQTLSTLHIPNSNSLIKRTRNNHTGIWVKADAKHIIGVPVKGFDGGPSCDVPEAEGFVVGGRDNEAGIRGEGKVGDALFVAVEVMERSDWGSGRTRGGEGIGFDGFVSGGRAEETAVGGEFDGGDGGFVAL